MLANCAHRLMRHMETEPAERRRERNRSVLHHFGDVLEFFQEMTANAIVDKLRAALSEPVDSECKVVYILAEARSS